MTAQTVIQVDSFCKAYDQEVAVKELTFSVAAGQVLGLIGPNGAGKTTTLRALTGILPASQGSLAVDGFLVDRDPIQVKQRTAYVPDDPQLFNDLTVQQHFAFVASAYGVPDWQSRMMNLTAQFDLQTRLESRASELSRGMRQKLAICCAYLYRPAALLLDEPMTGLDPRGIRMLKNSILEQAELGAAVVISSHLLAMVEDICTDVLILEQGSKRFHGTLDELKTEYDAHRQDATLEDIFFRAVEHEHGSAMDPTPANLAPVGADSSS